MAVFPNLKHDDCVQVCDCIRFDASKSVITAPHQESDVTMVEISADGLNFQVVHDSSGNRVYKKDWHLDWCYESIEPPEGPPAEPVGIIENNIQVPTNATTALSGSNVGFGQTYVATQSGDLDYFEINLQNLSGSAGQLFLEVRALDNDGNPTILDAAASAPVDIVSIPNDNMNLVRFDFAPGFEVLAGQTYYFAVLSVGRIGTLISHFDSSVELGGQFRFTISAPAVGQTENVYSFQDESLSFNVGLLEVSDEPTFTGVIGSATPCVRITLSDGTKFEKKSEIEIKTEQEDCLFSDDNDLVEHEHDILEWLPEGRSSFIYVHRRAKSRIFAWLEERGFRDCNGKPFTKEDVFKREEFKEWSTFLALRLIFNFVSNSNGDIYQEKYREYCKFEADARTRMYSLDIDGDGVQDKNEHGSVSLRTGLLVRG